MSRRPAVKVDFGADKNGIAASNNGLVADGCRCGAADSSGIDYHFIGAADGNNMYQPVGVYITDRFRVSPTRSLVSSRLWPRY